MVHKKTHIRQTKSEQIISEFNEDDRTVTSCIVISQRLTILKLHMPKKYE